VTSLATEEKTTHLAISRRKTQPTAIGRTPPDFLPSAMSLASKKGSYLRGTETRQNEIHKSCKRS
jgi:hypothetical protein